jgi:putative ABC transport system permease protein
MRDLISSMIGDARYALRGLRRTPAFSAGAILCTALGVCVTTTILSAVNAVLVRPLPYRDAGRLVAVYAQNIARGYHGSNISYLDYLDWRNRNRTFASLGIWTWSSHALSDGEAERVDGASVSANLFPTLGIEPILGRGFTTDEEVPGHDRVVLLSYGLWQRRFGGDRRVLEQPITVDGARYTVVGVMPPHFNFPDRGDVWVPFATDPSRESHGDRQYAGAIGRLGPGVSLEQARADLAVVDGQLRREFPNENVHWSAEVITLRDDLTGDLRRPVLIFLGAVGLVLLIACANVANLMLARGVARRREMAVRAALGAGRARVARLLLTESITIALVGGTVGTALSLWGVQLLGLAFPQGTPFYIALDLDGSVLVASLLLTIGTGLLFGAAPVIRAARLDLGSVLREDARGADAGQRGNRLRLVLATMEIALSVVLMVGATLLMKSYRAYTTTDLGFTERGVLTAQVSLPEAAYRESARRVAFYGSLIDRLRGLPGVVAVGSAQGIPFSGWNVQGPINVAGRAPLPRGEEVDSHFQWVSPDYFAAIGVPLVKGRSLTPADRDSVAPAGLVNERFVAKLFAHEDPIGKRVKIGDLNGPDPWVTIVGVVKDFRHYRLPQPMGPALYLPYASSPAFSQTLAIRTTLDDPYRVLPALRSAVRALDPTIPIYDVKTLDEAVSRSLWRQRLNGQVLSIFALLALLLATVGIYSVISYAVSQRTHEIGVRIALGASGADVLGIVVGQGMRLAIAGITLGAAASLVLARALTTLLYEVPATDRPTFIAVPSTVAIIVLLASYLPARRAMRVDPARSLRSN